MSEHEFTAGFFFCGLGAGALGFLEAFGRLGAAGARFGSVGGIDNDPAACRDFEYLTGSRALVADLSVLSPAELIAFMGERAPDALFLSPPCKGFSGLLSARAARAEKYQALNRLVFQGLFLACETWSAAPPPLIVLENVPRIRTRGRDLLAKVKQLLGRYGYVFHEATHECGEIGGLGQIRRRYLLVARRPVAVTAYVYRPPRQRVKACGEILASLPIPGDPAAGALHELPRISWLNWLRLALIPAGGDWRDLPTPERPAKAMAGALGVTPFEAPAATAIGESYPSNGPASVADPRVPLTTGDAAHTNIMAVAGWEGPSRTVTGAARPGAGALSVADPRLPLSGGRDRGHGGALGVNAWDAPSATVTGAMSVAGSNTPAAVSDPRLPGLESPVALGAEKRSVFARYDVGAWQEPARAIAGGGTNGAFGVADPRIAEMVAMPPVGAGWGRETKPQLMGVQSWDEPASTVVGKASISGGNARAAIADPRMLALGDNPERHWNKYHLDGWQEPAQTITGATRPGSGAAAVADPRDPFRGCLGVIDWREPAPTVRGIERVSQGAAAIVDPRLACEPRAGVYGVLSWEQAARAVTGNARIDNGSFAVADPRLPTVRDPKRERPDFIPVIVAADGTWHRPMTTLELAALQGLPARVRGAPLALAGRAIGRWRERIGNAVPVGAATAIAVTLLKALLASSLGTWTLSSTDIWVREDGVTEEQALAELGEALGAT